MKTGNRLNFLATQILLAISVCVSASAQSGVSFPEVSAGKNKGSKVFSTWKPSKKFLRNNPTFLADGTYTMSVEHINRRKYNYRTFHVNFPKHTQFSSVEYSAVKVSSTRQITTDGTAHIELFSMNDSDALYPVPVRGNAMEGTSGLAYSDSFPRLKRGYDHLNEYYEQEVRMVADKKISGPATISDLGSTLTDTIHTGPHDLYFRFEYVEAQAVNNHFLTCYLASFPPIISAFLPWSYPLLFTRKKSNDAYPSNLLVKLHVRNGAGEDIKTYGQVVFVREKHHSSLPLANAPWNTSALIFKQAMPVAMENLLNRFVEDTAVVNAINKRNQHIDELAHVHPEIQTYLQLQNKLAMIADTKLMLQRSIEQTNQEMISLGVVMGMNNSLNNPASTGNAVADQSASVAGTVAAAIMDNSIIKKLAALKDRQYDMREQYAHLEDKERQIAKEQASIMQNKELGDAWQARGAMN